jgi:hypothetical protein
MLQEAPVRTVITRQVDDNESEHLPQTAHTQI